MLRRALAPLVVLLLLVAVAGCGSTTPPPRVWVTPQHREPRLMTACVSTDCGPYTAKVSWSGISIASQTGFLIFLNGAQVADDTATPYVYIGVDCGTTFTFGVQAHNGSGGTGATFTASYTTPACGGTFPLTVSANGRFLQTASGTPFLMVGDSPQSLIGELPETSAQSYFADRVAHGFNSVWINLLCDDYTFCATDGKSYNDANSTADNLAPFNAGTTPSTYDITQPNATYFNRAHSIISDANADGLAVLLDPAETGGPANTCGGWVTMLVNAGTTADTAYGLFLGNKFKDLPNVIWMPGNDYSCWNVSADDAAIIAVENGIRSAGGQSATALQTLAMAYCTAGGDTCQGTSSLDDTTHSWSSILNLNGAYQYAPTYANVRRAYAQTPTTPAFQVEANYEGEQVGSADGCDGAGIGATQTATSVVICREQEWWTMTSGATGQLYGNYYTDAIGCGCDAGRGGAGTSAQTWTTGQIDTVGVTQLGYQTSLLNAVGEWYNLAPDTGHTLVTAGFGTCPTTGSMAAVNCVTAALTPDKKLALAYLPDPSSFASVTVDMSQMAGSTTARWYDPTNGTFTAISGSPFAASGTHVFAPTVNNSAGQKDWVLVLQA